MPKQLYLPVLLFLLHTTIPSVSAQWTTTDLSQAKGQMGAVALGSKAYFGGGSFQAGQTNKVEIYDAVTGTVTTKTLSVARAFPGAAGIGRKVFFAGGIFWDNLTHYATVDILDTLSQTWTTASLSAPRAYAQGLTIGNEVWFAGGFKKSAATTVFYDVIDVYNNNTGNWSTKSLSIGRSYMGVAVSGNIAVFAGGQTAVDQVTDRVDIYNSTTGVWTTATLSVARAFCAATAVGKKIIIAGGVTGANVNSTVVDIYDTETGVWTASNLSEARGFTTMGASVCGKAYFAGGGTVNLMFGAYQSGSKRVDVYDPATNTWSQDMLQNLLINHSMITVKNKLLVAGGVIFPTGFNKKIEIYTCTGISGTDDPEANLQLSLIPNPASETFTLEIPEALESAFKVEVFDFSGKMITNFELQGQSEKVISIADWKVGAYFVRVIGAKSFGVEKMIKI